MNRRLPPIPNKPSSLKLGQWRQSSLPEEHNPPGHSHNLAPFQSFDRHPDPQEDWHDRYRRLKPLTPTKPSTLSFRQSSALNGSPSYALFGNLPFQMPKVNASPTCLDGSRAGGNMAHYNGGPRTLPPVLGKSHSLGRSLPQTPPPPAPSHAGQLGSKIGGALGGITGLFNR